MVGGKSNDATGLPLGKIYIALLLIVFGGIVLHAPLSVGLGTLMPGYELLIKMWKELLMFVAAIAAILLLREKRQLHILKEPLLVGIAIYAALHLLLLPLLWQGLAESVAGLMIDLRYLLFFVLVYIAMRLYPSSRRIFIKVGIAGALVALIFALLQVFVLPVDILRHIGYSTSTITPYLTIDQNTDFIRINSTFRGPNPLGAYAGIVLTVLVAFALKHPVNKNNLRLGIVGALFIGGSVGLWASYSRSALVAAVVAILIVLAVVVGRTLSRRTWIISSVILAALAGGLVLGRDSSFVSNVVLHEDPGEGNSINSNDGHVESLQDGLSRMAVQPLGGGVGSTGSASLYGDSPLIIENQYLFIAHESGWLGLGLFLLIFVGVLNRLWQRRQDYLALGVFASGIGMALIGLLLPVWADDTVSIVWWGLAGLAIGGLKIARGESPIANSQILIASVETGGNKDE